MITFLISKIIAMTNLLKGKTMNSIGCPLFKIIKKILVRLFFGSCN